MRPPDLFSRYMGDGFRKREEVGSDDPRTIRSIAVTVDDVVTALEAVERDRGDVVLRVTPPFNGRMRARLHLAGSEGTYDGDVDPIHVDPRRLVADTPPFPSVDETEDRLRERGAYDVETHRREHERAVDAWRRSVAEHVVARATVETAAGPHEVDVKRLG